MYLGAIRSRRHLGKVKGWGEGQREREERVKGLEGKREMEGELQRGREGERGRGRCGRL